MFNFLIKKTLNELALRLSRDKALRDKLKNSAVKGIQSIKKNKNSQELIKNLGIKAGKLKNKIKDL